ncbi:unnamed protein product [Trichogramma brassicae]|uniref:Uncharacterized protein n=1 Tax=Trichogramma brassicae TaxID=86971 RepID=A0A6H5J9S7_9HYME|nr:unnamed protein product [Trichogramma brassicae]
MQTRSEDAMDWEESVQPRQLQLATAGRGSNGRTPTGGEMPASVDVPTAWHASPPSPSPGEGRRAERRRRAAIGG